jgi:hypothetical protein
VSRLQKVYVEYLIAMCSKYTCTNLSDYLAGAAWNSHDPICDLLRRARLTARGLWDLLAPLIEDGPGSNLILDDSAQNQHYSKHIELVNPNTAGQSMVWFVASA